MSIAFVASAGRARAFFDCLLLGLDFDFLTVVSMTLVRLFEPALNQYPSCLMRDCRTAHTCRLLVAVFSLFSCLLDLAPGSSWWLMRNGLWVFQDDFLSSSSM